MSRPRQSVGRLVALIAGAALLPACYVDSQPYYAIDSGMEPAERGEFEVRNLYFSGEVPLRYALETDRYALIAEIDPERLSPSLLFSVISKTLPNPTVSGESPSACFGSFISPMYVYPDLKDARHIIQFLSNAYASPKCRDDAYLRNGHATVIVTVADDNGEVAGIHELTISLENTGIRVTSDSL